MTFQELMGVFNFGESNEVVYQNLLTHLTQNRFGVTPVIGAGLSCWAGYSTWKQFLTENATSPQLQTTVNDLLNRDAYEAAASELQKAYRTNAFLRLLQRDFSPDKLNTATRPSYQKLLPDLFTGYFVTTNFDVSLEKLLDAPFVITPEDTYDKDAFEASIQNHGVGQRRWLVKLHGTIESPRNMILTKERYDDAYGTDPKNPDDRLQLPSVLKQIFKSSVPFFLGCGMGTDRTCAVFKKCTNATGFALLELPEETKNETNPLQPHLENIPALETRLDEIDDLNLQVIWYPHGMHDAVEVLIKQLAKDLNISPDPTPPGDDMEQAVLYKVTENFRGREAEVDRVVEWIKNPQNSVLLLHGVAGIGKTEICKEAYRRYKQENSSFSMPLIDVAKAETTGSFWALFADGLGISLEGVAPDNVHSHLKNAIHTRCHSGAACFAYLDNFEEIWDKLCLKERQSLFRQIHTLNGVGLRLLISSQVTLPFGQNVEVQPLDNDIKQITDLPWDNFCQLDQVKLFLEILGRQPRETERDALRQLIGEMGGHPLSIKLTACYGRDSGSLTELLDSWSRIELPESDETDRHESLRRSLALAWRNVRDDPAAVMRWALHAHSLDPLDAETLRELNGLQESPFSETDWQNGGRLLRRFGLIETMEDDKERMLLAVKKIFPLPGAEAQAADAAALELWVRWCAAVLKQGDDRKQADYLCCHDQALQWLPQCFYLAECCLDAHDYGRLAVLLYNAYNFYQFDVVRSLPLLNRLVQEMPPDFPLRGPVLLAKGDLLRFTGKPDDARKAYDEAEKLYKKEKASLGLANVLQAKGDLLYYTDEHDEALEAYDEAEKLYKKEKDSLGLAKVLKAKGDLLRLTGKPDEAQKAYDEAEKLYKKEKNSLGLANVLLEKGDLLRRTGKPDEARKAYDEAEKLYKKEKASLGLANVLQAKGDLLHLQEDWQGAAAFYREALSLYRQVQHPRGICYTLAELQLCQKQLGDEDGWLKSVEELTDLLPDQPKPVQKYCEYALEEASQIT